MTRAPATALVRLYSVLANMAAPFAARRAIAKLRQQGVDPKRFPEKKGHASKPRPAGKVVWFHAASVGESLSVLRLIGHLGTLHPHLSFLITSGTATSAEILSRRLPARTTHQFAPLDARGYLRRFLDHWQPNAAVFVESELWPQMIRETAGRAIPMALLNARISERSARNWTRAARTSRHIISHFDLIHCQDAKTAALLATLGRGDAKAGQNLKSLSGALPYDAKEHAHMKTVLQGRPVWLASSTHPGEDEIMLRAHKSLLASFPGLLLILVPRHPERADHIEVMIAEHGLSGTRRSRGGRVDGTTQVYLADTLGETGLWYALCPLTCLCGSFTPVGGHNPYEPAHAGSGVLHGVHFANFAQSYADMDAAGGARQVLDATDLAETLTVFLNTPAELRQLGQSARGFAQGQADALDEIAQDLSKALSLG
ncbi:MAG: 3-deoxy-D-manno-octulosonic acid transferase [Roseovarius sp.]|nr:3-deoxy-D-manno-octulosonic acid transferase [Roseovarius sp.]